MIAELNSYLYQNYEMPYVRVTEEEFYVAYDMFINSKTVPLPENASGALCHYYGVYYSKEEYYLKAMMKGFPSTEESLRKLVETKDDLFSVLLYRLLTCKPVDRGIHIWSYVSSMIESDNEDGIIKLFTITKEPLVPHTRKACTDLMLELAGALDSCSEKVYVAIGKLIESIDEHVQESETVDLIETYAGTYARMKYSIPRTLAEQSAAFMMFEHDELPRGDISEDMATLAQIYHFGMGDYDLTIKYGLMAITKGSIKAAWNMYVLSNGTPEESFYWMVFNMMADSKSAYLMTYMTEAIVREDPDMFLMPERLLPDFFTRELAGRVILYLSDQLKVFDRYELPIREEVIRLIEKHMGECSYITDYERQAALVEYMLSCVASSNVLGLIKVMDMDLTIVDESLLERCMEVFLWLENQPKIEGFDTLKFAAKIGLQ